MARIMHGDFWEEVDRFHKHIEENYQRNEKDFVIPTREEMEGLVRLGIAMKIKDFDKAEQLIQQYDFPFEVVHYTDITNDYAVYHMLREKYDQGDHRGWGIYVWAERPSFPVVVQVTHPIFDGQTHNVGARVFRAGAYGFFMHGSHRYSWPSASDQTGLFSNRIAKSDPSGTDLIPMLAFQLVESRPDRVFIQIHGFTKRNSPERADYPAVIVSEGSPAGPGSSRVKAFVDQLNQAGLRAGLYHGTAFERVHDDEEGEFFYGDLGAEANRGGAWTNALLVKPGHFIHCEIETIFRVNSPRFTADAVIKAAKAVFPSMDSLPTFGTRVSTKPLTARFLDANPSKVRVYFSGPLVNPGTVNDWRSDLTISSVNLVDHGYAVELDVSGTVRGKVHHFYLANELTDLYGDPVEANVKVYAVGISTSDIFAGEDTPLSRIRKNLEMFPVQDVWDGLQSSGANIIRTRPYHSLLPRMHNGTVTLFKKRSQQYISTFLYKNVAPAQELWFKADIYIPEDYDQISDSIYVARISENESNINDGIRLNLRKQTDGKIYWQIRDGTNAGTGTGPNFPEREVKPGQWQTIEFCCRVGTTQQELWIDGVQVATMTLEVPVQSVQHVRVGFNYASDPSADMIEVFMSNIRISTERHGPDQPYNRIMFPMLQTDLHEIDQQTTYTAIQINDEISSVEVAVPIAFNGNDVFIRGRIYDEGGNLVDTVTSLTVPSGQGKVTLNFNQPLRQGYTLALDASDGAVYSDVNYYHFQKVPDPLPLSVISSETLIVTNQDRQSEALTDFTDVEVKRTLNGDHTLQFTVYQTGSNYHAFNMLQNENFVTLRNKTYRIKRVTNLTANNTPVKQVMARHRFFDIVDDWQYEKISGTFTIEEAVAHALEPTPYDYRIEGDFGSATLTDFGDNSSLALLNQIRQEFICEYEFEDETNTVVIKEQIGRVTDAQIRHNHNLEAFEYYIDTSNLSTYIEGYGKRNEETGEYEQIAFYTSPNADLYKDDQGNVRLKHAPPVRDNRYTKYESLLERLKAELNDKPIYSLTAEVTELRRNMDPNGEKIHDFDLGDIVTIIHEILGLNFQARVVEYVEYPFSPLPPRVTIGNLRNNSIAFQAKTVGSGTGIGGSTSGSIDLHDGTIRANDYVYMGHLGLYQIHPDDNTKRVLHGAYGSRYTNGMIMVQRPGGFTWIDNGVLLLHIPVTPSDPPMTETETETGYWKTNQTEEQICQYYTFNHQARYLKLNLVFVLMAPDPNQVEGRGEIIVYEDGEELTELIRYTFQNTDEQQEVLTIDLGMPTSEEKSIYLKLRVDDDQYTAKLRNNRIWLEG